MNTRRARPRGVTAASNCRDSAVSSLKRELHGYQNKLTHLAPPQVNRRPYNTIVVAQTYLSDGTSIGITVSNIVKALISQYGLVTQNAASITFKLRRVDCYAVSKANSDIRPSVNADYSSLVPSVGDPTTPGNAIVSYTLLKRLADIGNVAEAACVSYTWPLAMRDIPLSQTADFVLVTAATNVTELDCRFHLSWSMADIADPIP